MSEKSETIADTLIAQVDTPKVVADEPPKVIPAFMLDGEDESEH